MGIRKTDEDIGSRTSLTRSAACFSTPTSAWSPEAHAGRSPLIIDRLDVNKLTRVLEAAWPVVRPIEGPQEMPGFGEPS